MSRTIKITLIVSAVIVALTGIGVLGYMTYLSEVRVADNVPAVTTTTLDKRTLEQKELDLAGADIKADNDLDTEELDDISSDLDKVDLNGI